MRLSAIAGRRWTLLTGAARPRKSSLCALHRLPVLHSPSWCGSIRRRRCHWPAARRSSGGPLRAAGSRRQLPIGPSRRSVPRPRNSPGVRRCLAAPLAYSRQQGRVTVYFHRALVVQWAALAAQAASRQPGLIPLWRASGLCFCLRHREEGSAPVHHGHNDVGATNVYTSGLFAPPPCPLPSPPRPTQM